MVRRLSRKTFLSRLLTTCLVIVFTTSFTGVGGATPVRAGSQDSTQTVDPVAPQPEVEAPQVDAEAPVEEDASAEAPADEAPVDPTPQEGESEEAAGGTATAVSPTRSGVPTRDQTIKVASLVAPVFVNGNPPLEEGGMRINGPTTGTYGPVTITLRGTALGQVMDFTSTRPVCKVVVKGGPYANVYNYGTPVMSDTGLHAPLDDGTSGAAIQPACHYKDISHIDFYFCDNPPDLDVEKTVDFNGDGVFSDSETYYAGEEATWKIVVSNGSEGGLAYGVTVVDSNGQSFGPVDLEAGESETYTYTTTVHEDILNTATATGFDGQEEPIDPVSDDASADTVGQPGLSVDKTVDFNGDGIFSDFETYYAGATATWKIVVTNSGDSDLYMVTAQDSNGQSFGPIEHLAAGESATFTYADTIESDTVNTASASGYDQVEELVEAGSDDASVDAISPNFTVKKYVDFDGDGEYSDDTEVNYAGETASWQLVFTNTGDVPVVVGYIDGLGQSGAVFLEAGQSETVNYDSVVYVNTENVVGAVMVDPLGRPSEPQFDAATALVAFSGDLHVDKTVDFDGDGVFNDSETSYAGDTATWKIVVSNGPEAGPVYGVTVTDSNGQSFGPIDLAAGESETYTYTTTVSEDTLNTATANGYDGLENEAGPVSDDANADAISPALAVEKTVDFNGDGVFNDSEIYYAGSPATWKIVVTNTGDADLFGATVTDSNGQSFGPIDLAAGASETFTYTETIDSDKVNVAGATAYDEFEETVEADSDDASVDMISPSFVVKKYVDFDGDGNYSDDSESNYAGAAASWLLAFTNTGDVPMLVGYADVAGQSGLLFLDVGATETVVYGTTVDVDTVNTVGAVGIDSLEHQSEPQFDSAEARVAHYGDLSVDKTVDFNGDGVFNDSETYYAGEQATWKIVVSNGPEAGPVYGVTVTDSNGQTFGPIDLAAGESETCTYSTTVYGDTLNTATANGYDALENPVEPVSDDANADAISPALAVEKTVDFNGDGVFSGSETYYAGAPATWKIVVTNTGDADLFGVTVTDSNGQSFGPIDLAAGESETFIYTETVDSDTVNAATATAFDELEETVEADSDDASVDAISPGFTVKKYVDFDGDGIYSDDSEANYAGQSASWQLVFTNTGDVPMIISYVDINGQTGIVSLDAGATETVTYSSIVFADEINTVTAIGIDPLGEPSEERYDTAAVLAILPGDLRIEKTVDFNGDGVFGDSETDYAGEVATWKIVVSNGPEGEGMELARVLSGGDLYGVTVTDTNGGSWGPFDLAGGESHTITYTETIASDKTNVATATGIDQLENEVGPVSDDAAVDAINPELTVDKTVDFNGDGVFGDSETYYAGSGATWKVVVTNSGDCDVFGATVTDSNGQSFGPVDLAAGASATYTYVTTVVSDTVNVANASGYDQFEQTVDADSDDASVDAISPGFTVKKYVDFDGDGIYSDDSEANYAGQSASWQLVFTNTGDVPMIISYVDVNGQTGILSLDAGATETVTYSSIVFADEINTVTAIGIDPLGESSEEQYDTAAVLATLPSDLRIEKTVDFNGDGASNDSEVWYAGEDATWTITVSNGYGYDQIEAAPYMPAGPVYGVMVTDTNGQTWGPFDLAGGESRTFTYSETIDADKTNVATASGYDGMENEVGPVEDSSAVDAIAPSISVVESCDAPPEGVPTGSTVTYTFLVTNGPEPLTNVRLVNSVLGVDEGLGDLAPGQTVEYSTDSVLNAPTTDSVVVTGLDQFENIVSDDDGLFVDIFSPFTETDVGIQKFADQETVDAGSIVTYTLTYTNNGDTPVQNFTVTDDYDEQYSDVEDAAGGVVSDGQIVWTVDEVLQPGQSGSIVYQLRISDELPVGTTQVDNVVFITADGDSDSSNNRASRQVEAAFLPFTEDDDGPFLPFTGGNAALIALVAAAAAGAGTVLRRRSRRTD